MWCQSLVLALAVASQAQAMVFYATDDSAIRKSASSVAKTLMSFYDDSNVGVLPSPYFWWESGALWGGMIEYWHYTGDSTYNDAVSKALASQASPTNDFLLPPCEGNDDQGWWALAAMSAAEHDLAKPDGSPSWFTLADNVFNAMQKRWDMGSCNGGLKWKISSSADGYHYKSTISNAVFFQLAARLARFTGDAKYADSASRTFDWVKSVGLIDDDYNVFDGTDDLKGCSDVNHDKWSYNVGVFLYGSAVMQDYTGDAKWSERTSGLLGAAADAFFDSDVMIEKCEKENSCNVDQLTFKAILSRSLAATAVLIPSTRDKIATLLKSSASGAAASCGDVCGTKWTINKWDGTKGVGQQLSALEVMQGNLHLVAPTPGSRRKHSRQFRNVRCA